ncbi:MAG: HepT-like ribonuclease domain-containing protein [Patescibacteria group bacterium]
MLDSPFIRRKIGLIQEDLKRLERFRRLTFHEMASEWERWSALEWTLAKIIGRAIDINRHILAELSGKDIAPPKDYTETFLLLERLHILPEIFAQHIAASAGFRNRIIHEYNELDQQTVYQTVGDAITQYAEYCRYILEFLEHETNA